MSVLKPVNRTSPLVHEPPSPLFGAPAWLDNTLALGGFGLTIDEGPFVSPLTLSLGGFGIAFDVTTGQAPWTLALGGFGVAFEPADSAAWTLPLGGFGLVIGERIGTPADSHAWTLSLGGFGLAFEPPWLLSLGGFGLSIEPASLTTRSVTYCYNLRSDGGPQATTWTNWPFAKIVRVNGVNYAMNGENLYSLGGTSDNGTAISSSVTLAPFAGVKDKQSRTFKSRCPYAHVGANAGGAIYAAIDVDGTETYQEYGPYNIDKGRGNLRRAQLGRGLLSGFWQFRITNNDGERLKLSSLTFDFEQTSRRV